MPSTGSIHIPIFDKLISLFFGMFSIVCKHCSVSVTENEGEMILASSSIDSLDSLLNNFSKEIENCYRYKRIRISYSVRQEYLLECHSHQFEFFHH